MAAARFHETLPVRLGKLYPEAALEGGDDVRLIGGRALGMAEFWSVAGHASEGRLFTGRRG